MPTYTTTARHALRRLIGTNVISDVDAGIAALADDLAAIIATDDQGTLAGRPVSTPGSPGVTGRYYRDTATGLVYRDHGTGWKAVSGFVEGLLSARPLASTMPGAAWVSTDTEELSYALQDGTGWLEMSGTTRVHTVASDAEADQTAITSMAAIKLANGATDVSVTIARTGLYRPTLACAGQAPDNSQAVFEGYRVGDAAILARGTFVTASEGYFGGQDTDGEGFVQVATQPVFQGRPRTLVAGDVIKLRASCTASMAVDRRMTSLVLELARAI